jgi:hypothetical protein
MRDRLAGNPLDLFPDENGQIHDHDDGGVPGCRDLGRHRIRAGGTVSGFSHEPAPDALSFWSPMWSP